jgi:L-iditol 2-dehydrogenase
MRAVQLFSPGDVRCVEVDIPQIQQSKDVIIKVKSVGVCGSDIPRVMSKGAYRYPITIGHEFAGQVTEVGPDVNNVKPGDRVTIMPLIPCGVCKFCQIGEAVVCDNYDYYGSRIDGAMAEYINVCADNILKLPPGVDYEAGSMTDPSSVALHAVRKANILPGQSAVVFGLGAIGYLTVQWLKSMGCNTVIAVDIYDNKLKLAEMLGADYCVNGKTQNVVETIMDLTNGFGVDASIELAGSKITQIQSIEAVRKLGTVVYCGISYDDLLLPNNVLSKILRGEIKLKGSWNSSIAPLPINEWESSLAAMKSGKLRTDPLVTHRFRLEDCQEAFNMMYNKTEVFTKVLFKPED